MSVGIFDNITTSATINDKGSLELTFTQQTGEVQAEAKEVSLLDSLSSGEVVGGSGAGENARITIFPFRSTNTSTGDALPHEMIVQDIQNFQAQLNSILGVYFPVDQIKYNPFRGLKTPITNDNLQAEFQKQEVLDTLYKNYSEDFIAMMEKADKGKLARLLLVRRKNSKYTSLRNKFLKDQPFIESMEVPVEKSRLKFTKFEKDNGLDKPLEVSADPNTGGDVASLFGETSAPVADVELPFAQ
ncbi:hypothetical protein Q5H92_14985 [Hymenobacter sp. M29]|uniref:DUF3945 domain-containing protein n=1 Tax=Hymenobacter mellowenesis TaxID=3063995 RepID=A0ABT9AG61_9BACT|nr:hypothetical protein [Hymenobacter sp. M29]MDO7847672.1 hypothetical protein [Hymenobacter sp. M29]